jgi:hypothetical protein
MMSGACGDRSRFGLLVSDLKNVTIWSKNYSFFNTWTSCGNFKETVRPPVKEKRARQKVEDDSGDEEELAELKSQRKAF